MNNTDPPTLYVTALRQLAEATVSKTFNLDRWRTATREAWFAYDALSPVEQRGVIRPDDA